MSSQEIVIHVADKPDMVIKATFQSATKVKLPKKLKKRKPANFLTTLEHVLDQILPRDVKDVWLSYEPASPSPAKEGV